MFQMTNIHRQVQIQMNQFCAGKWEVTFPVFDPFVYVSFLKMQDVYA